MLRPVVLALCLALPIAAQNPNPELLSNGSFEAGFAGGWGIFNNAFLENANPPQFSPLTGTRLVSLFGQFGGVGVQTESGVFQRLLCMPGETFEISGSARHWSGDAMIGGGSATNSNFVLMRIAFFDGSQVEIPNSGANGLLLDGTFATDVWHTAAPVKAEAPLGAVSVQALAIYIQPGLDPGACHIDDLSLKRAYDLDSQVDPMTGDVTLSLSAGTPFTLFGNLIAADPLNGTMPGMGPTAGLFISQAEADFQVPLIFSGVPPFGGLLDATGSWSFFIPGAAIPGLRGVTLYALGLQLYPNGTLDASLVTPIVL